MKAVIIGSGMSGATAARLLADAGHSVRVLDTRDHAGGIVMMNGWKIG